MEIKKSSRHQKIIGDFGENLVCNWLSRSGFEVILVDHTGIDIIAYNPSKKQRLGITVKFRTRDAGKEKGSVNVLSYQKEKDDRQKLLNACEAFACEPWIAVYVETLEFADLFINDKEYQPVPVIKLTSIYLKGSISSADNSDKINDFISNNNFSNSQKELIENLLHEANENKFLITIENAI